MSGKNFPKLLEFRDLDEKSKETARELEDNYSKNKEENPNKEPMEDTKKTVEEVTEALKTESSQSIDMPETLDEVETLENPERNTTVHKMFKSYVSQHPEEREMIKGMTKISTSQELKILKTLKRPNTKSEMSTSAKLEKSDSCEVLDSSKIYPICETMSEMSISDKPENLNVPKTCQTPKTTSEASTLTETPKKEEMCKVCKTKSETSAADKIEEPEIPEVRRTCSLSKISDKIEEPETPEVRRTHSTASQMSICKYFDEIVERKGNTMSEVSNILSSIISEHEAEVKDFKDYLEDVNKKIEESSLKKSADDVGKFVMIPVIDKDKSAEDVIRMRRKFWPPMSMPDLTRRPLVLATHQMVPSLPIGLFEIFAEMIEVVTDTPVVLLHECRINRSVATQVVDIAILPTAESWDDGVLLPASFVFEHPLNKDKTADVYADVIVANDRASHIKDIMGLRGHRCAIPENRYQFTASRLLFDHLHSKGENLIFFGNILDASTQLEVLEMVAGKQAEVGVLESPVIRCNKYTVPGVDSLHILTSLGPLPPYRIMIKNTLGDKFAEELKTYLLKVNENVGWMERLLPYGVTGFAKNSMDYYNLVEKKRIATNVPYY